jgi:hypothetical protein
MYHQSSKRKALLQRTAIYSFMTLTVVGLVTVLVFVMLGYQFNGNDGKIEQGGLVQFDSVPSGAQVAIDGANFGTRTASKTTMSSGQHFVTMNRTGYDTWQKSVLVVPGSVLWLNYARLVPAERTPSSVHDFDSVAASAISNNNKILAIHEVSESPSIHLADLSREDAKITGITIPDSAYTAPSADKAQRFGVVTWDPSDRYLLVKHVFDDDKVEWLVVDTQDTAATKNVTTLLDVEMSEVVFSNGDSRQLYVKVGSDVRKIDLDDATLSRPLITGVASFSLYSDSMITYVTRRDEKTGKRSVGYYIDGTTTQRTVREFDDDGNAPLLFAVGRYFNETFEAIAYGDTVEILSGDLPRDTAAKLQLKPVATMSLVGGAQYLSDKTNGRFIVAQNGATYATHDLELGKSTTTTLKGSGEVTKELAWIDGYMPWSDRDGMLRIYEFDGANQHDIMPVVSGQAAALSPSGKYLYGVTRSDDGVYHLSRVQMIL